MGFDEATLRLKLGGLTTTVLTSGMATDCLADATLAVSKKLGESHAVIFKTVADQQEYALPDQEDVEGTPIDIRSIQKIIWHIDGSVVESPQVLGDVARSGTYMDRGLDPTNLTLNDIHDRFLVDRSRGSWKPMNGKIWLDPVPEDDDYDVMVIYRKTWTAAASIPTEYADQFWLIAVASALERLAIVDAPIIEVYEGTQKIRLSGGVTYLKHAAALRSRFERGL